MSVSRRKLLQHSIFAAAACAVGALPALAAKNKNVVHSNLPPVTVENAGLKPLARPAFEATIGSGFRVTPTSGKSPAVWLRLLAVKDLPALAPVNTGMMAVSPPKQKSAPVNTSGFMLSFLGTLPKPLPQDTYTFEHARLGKFSLLIVPDKDGEQTYTATINRLS
jgi:hypothetical protein